MRTVITTEEKVAGTLRDLGNLLNDIHSDVALLKTRARQAEALHRQLKNQLAEYARANKNCINHLMNTDPNSEEPAEKPVPKKVRAARRAGLKKMYPKLGIQWTEELDDKVRDLLARGYAYSEMAPIIGKPAEAIRQRARRAELKG